MQFTYLGRYTAGKVKVSVFFESREQVVVSVLSNGASALVQAWKKLVLAGGRLTKSTDLSGLHALVSGHSATLELVTTRPSTQLQERVTPHTDSKTKWIEQALRKLEREIERAKDEYARWRGVRDLDEAHENLSNRHEEIFDLNQKLVANAREPHFVYSPGKWHPSEWQRTDRVRFHELKDQAKERASSLRSRIDFTYRDRIKQLEEKRRELQHEIESERKKDKEHNERHATLIDKGTAAAVLLTVRSRPVFAPGAKRDAVHAAAQDVTREATSLRVKLAERLGLNFKDADELFLLTPILIPNVASLLRSGDALASDLAEATERALNLTPRAALEKETAKTVAQLLTKTSTPPLQVPDLSRFPTLKDAASRRLVYLGKAMDTNLKPTEGLIFYDLDAQAPRHTSVSGGSGSGKSLTARLVIEGAALHGIPAVIFDPTRSWTGLASPCAAGALLARYKAFRMRPEWARGFDLKIVELQPQGPHPAELLTSQGLTVIAAWKLTVEQERAAVSGLLGRVAKEVTAWPESQKLRAMLVFEEAHRYLQEPAIESTIELLARTARARGLGLLFVSQNNVDLPPGVRNNTASRFQLQTGYGPDLTRAGQVFGSDYAKKIPSLQQGCGVVNYSEYGSALVAFRPPLHNPSAISEDVAAFYTLNKEFEHVVRQLLADVRPSGHDTARQTTDAINEGATPPEAHRTTDTDTDQPHLRTDDRTVRTWREAAERLASPNITSAALAEALRREGIEPPSERTLRRFLRSKSGASS